MLCHSTSRSKPSTLFDLVLPVDRPLLVLYRPTEGVPTVKSPNKQF